MKENDGRAARRSSFKLLQWFLMVQFGFFLLYVVVSHEGRELATGNLRASSEIGSHHHHKISPKEQAVLDAKYFLIDVELKNATMSISPDANGHSTPPVYHGVVGVFCPIDWHLQKGNPTGFPIYHDLIQGSTHCQKQKFQLDLKSLVHKARRFDQQSSSQQQPQSLLSVGMHELKLSGLVLHESRCGSTLVSNVLASQTQHRVYAEAQVLWSVLSVCDRRGDCHPDVRDALLKDVVYLLSRSSDRTEKHVFLKMQSISTWHLSTLTRVFPHVPWIFVYREGVEIMASHFPENQKNHHDAVCLRSRKHPPSILSELVSKEGRELDSLSIAEYCAVHLASICEAALREYDASGRGRFVNYNQLPDILWDSILPDHFHLEPLHAHQLSRMKEVAALDARGNATVVFQQDSARKHEISSEEIHQAVNTFLKPLYSRMQEITQT